MLIGVDRAMAMVRGVALATFMVKAPINTDICSKKNSHTLAHVINCACTIDPVSKIAYYIIIF